MSKLLKKLLPVKIKALVYFMPKESDINIDASLFEVKIFTGNYRSGIDKIDKRTNENNSCYTVFINSELAHVTWLFKNKLLTKQLGEKNAYTVGDSLTNEKYRGKGIYPFVLRTIAKATSKDIIIYVEPDNIASVRGIEKAGFKKKYSFSMIRFLGVKLWCTKHAA